MTEPLIVFLDAATLPVPLKSLPLAHRWVNHAHTRADEVVARLQGATVAVTNKVAITAEMLSLLPQLRLIAVAATGFNNIDLAACCTHTVGVCNIRDYAIHGVAEHTLMLMLALRRQLLSDRQRVQAGEWQNASGFCLPANPALEPPHDLAGSRLVLVGSGALGQATAKLGAAFGMQVFFAGRKGQPETRPGYLPWEEALRTADVLSIHCPLTDDTRGLIGAAELALLRPSAIVLNTARGGIVDEAALLAALQTRQIAGAGLDVLSSEPPRQGNPLLDVQLPNLLITPHVAWASVETMQTLADQLIDNIAGYLTGAPRNLL